MSGIFGTLGLSESGSDRVFVNTLGQRLVYDAVQAEMTKHNADLDAALSFFLEETTESFKERFKLPGGGYLQPRGINATPGAVKAYGSWDVAYPLNDYGAQLATNDIGLAYMSLAELNRHIDTVTLQDKNTIRRELLKALLDGSGYTFNDPIYGNLSVVPLANGDSVVYPPVLGTDSEATENHFIGTNYVVSGISDTNNPCLTVRDELEEHFGTPTGGSDIVMFVDPTVGVKLEALTDFDPVVNRFVTPGVNTAIPHDLPSNMPGRVLGVCNSVWIVEWRWLPTAYALAQYIGAPKPLKQRVDPADTGLGQGLQLVATDDDHPFNMAYYRHRFGFGVGNRLNGVALQFVASTSYSSPSGFSH